MFIMWCKKEFRLCNFKLSCDEPQRFVTSQWGFPRLYCVWRLFGAIFHTSWLLGSIIVTQTTSPLGGAVWLIYLTNWTYLLLTLIAVFDAVIVLYVRAERKDILKGCSPHMTWYLKLSWLLYNIVNEGALHITAFYWIFLFKDQDLTVLRFVLHGVNSIYILANIFITNMPVRVYHVVYPLIFGIIYTIFTVIYQACGGTNEKGEPFIYKITDWSKPKRTLPLVCLSTFLFLPCIHMIVYLLYMLRMYIHKKYNEKVILSERDSDKTDDLLL